MAIPTLVLSNRISPADGALLLDLRRELAFRRRWGRWAGVVRFALAVFR